MANGISDIGNNLGLLYAVDSSGQIVGVVKNNVSGIWQMKNAGLLSNPFSGQRSAFGVLTITGILGAGSITSIDINGVNQLSAVIAVGGGDTPSSVASSIEANVNAFAPGSGPDFKAVAIAGSVYFYAPASFGATPNGWAIGVTDTGSVISWTSTVLKNGANSSGNVDPLFGFSIYINADYGANGISGELTADPTSLLYAVDISKYVVNRGLNNSVPSGIFTIQGYAISGINRSSVITFVQLQPFGGSTDTLVKINADDFTDGDMLFISCYNAANTITVESLNAITIGGATGNIALTDDIPWVSGKYKTLLLSFRSDPVAGPIFTEISRSFAAPSDLKIPVGNTLFVSKAGDDTSAKRESLLYHYLTITAALADAVSGDTIIVYPGTYAEGNFQKDGVNFYFYDGVTIACPVGVPFLNVTTETMIIDGLANISTDSANILTMNNGGSGNITLNCKNMSARVGSLQLNSGTTHINIAETYESNYRNIYFAFTGTHYVKATTLKQTFLAGAFSAFGTYIIRCGTSAASPFVGTAHVECEEMIIDTVNSAGGQPLMYLESINTPGSLKVNAKRMFNRFTTFATISIYVANRVDNVEITGDLYCDGAGSLAHGIYCVQPAGVSQPQYLKFNGNIYLEDGYALRMSACPNVEINGDIIKKGSGTPVSPFANDAAIYFESGAPSGSAGIANFKLRGNIYVTATTVNAINKALQGCTNPTYAPRTQLDPVCDIRGSLVYVADPARYVCEGPLATEVLIDNSIVTTGTISNLAAPLSAGMVAVGGAIVADGRVAKDSPLIPMVFPELNY